MLSALAFALMMVAVRGQTLNNDSSDALGQLFGSTSECPIPGLCSGGLEPVTSSTTPSSRGYIKKCGEGDDMGKHLCVNYEYCDGRTNTIVQNGLTAGFGVIDIRFKESRCEHVLEKCCTIPEGGLSPGFDPTSKPPTSPTITTESPPPTVPTSPTVTRPPVSPVTSSFCGTRNVNGTDFQIIGNVNKEAQYGEFPWMVALMNRHTTPTPGQPFSFCGGSLINPSVVLTTAHCVMKYQAADLKVRVGEWDSQTTRERLPYQERNVVEIVSHKNFVPAGVFNDFALLILDSPVNKADHISTICLPDQDEVITSRNCFVSGWGKDVFGSGGVFQDILKKIELPMVPNAACQAALRKTALGPTYILHDSFVCAGGEEGKDACTGDGGSPLVCPDPKNPNRYLLTGMVAWGIGCGKLNVPGAYAAVARFRSWIDDNMRRLNLDTNTYVL